MPRRTNLIASVETDITNGQHDTARRNQGEGSAAVPVFDSSTKIDIAQMNLSDAVHEKDEAAFKRRRYDEGCDLKPFGGGDRQKQTRSKGEKGIQSIHLRENSVDSVRKYWRCRC